MSYHFSKSVGALRSSAIRDLMSIATRTDIISFAGGMPGNELFPVDALREMMQTMPLTQLQEGMQYGPTGGYPPLLDALKERLRKKGFPVETNGLIITTGSLQALNILGKLFVNPGDTVLTENPVFIGGVSAFSQYEANITGIDLDEDGISIEQLKTALIQKPKFLYITPNFHNPAGIVYSRERRVQLIETLRDTDVPIIEDDAYGELFFDEDTCQISRPMKTWVDADMDKQIFYTGSFSKVFGPGLRIAWALTPPEVCNKMSICKQSIDACSPMLSQVLMYEFMRTGRLEPYIDFLRKTYKQRRDMMLDAIERYFPKEVTFVNPRGGFYLWLKMPQGIDEELLFHNVLDKGAVFVLGGVFDPHGKKNGYIRLSYCNTPEDQIERGIKIIGSCLKEMLVNIKHV
ncbi:MAG: PLP-dependent aminotransferase family protein [Prevotellaceae bacterium]|jgi:DNA-binding transcriptional MocR family regulator|nr:PLP-dependent aminotransferase family protein [Prevotellaceae bacterium]